MNVELLQKVEAFRDKAIAIGHNAGKPLFFPDGLAEMNRGELIAERDRLLAESDRNRQECFDLLDIANTQVEVADALSDLINAMGKEDKR